MTDTQQPSKVIHLSSEDFDQAVAKTNDQPLLVDFYAEWCAPCKLAAPVLDKFSHTYDGKITIAKLDVDDNNDIASKFGVVSIPTVIVFKNGQEVNRKIGFPGEPGYRQMIEAAVAA